MSIDISLIDEEVANTVINYVCDLKSSEEIKGTDKYIEDMVKNLSNKILVDGSGVKVDEIKEFYNDIKSIYIYICYIASKHTNVQLHQTGLNVELLKIMINMFNLQKILHLDSRDSCDAHIVYNTNVTYDKGVYYTFARMSDKTIIKGDEYFIVPRNTNLICIKHDGHNRNVMINVNEIMPFFKGTWFNKQKLVCWNVINMPEIKEDQMSYNFCMELSWYSQLSQKPINNKSYIDLYNLISNYEKFVSVTPKIKTTRTKKTAIDLK
jgi:hypothetical protein